MRNRYFELAINFKDPDLDAEERDKEVEKLLVQLKEMDEVDSASRVYDPNPSEGTKSVGGFLVGLLTAEVSIDNCQKLLGFLGDRLSGKPIEMEVDANGKKLKVTAYSKEELEAAIKAAKDFVNA